MLRMYPPNSLVHAIMLMVFFAPTYYMFRTHDRVMSLDSDRISVTALQAMWIVTLFCGPLVVFGISFIWSLVGELVFAVLKMESPYAQQLKRLNDPSA